MRAGRSVHRQFFYGHCGVHVDEPAAQHATQTMATGQYTEHGIAPIWHTDPLTCFTAQPSNKWRRTIRQDTHRYSLCGARKRSLLPQDQPTSTGTPVDTQETFHHLLLECPGTSAARQRGAFRKIHAAKSSLSGSCFTAGGFFRCSTASSAPRWHRAARRVGKSGKTNKNK
ncbi:putative RNase H [Trypanosoma cruzi]|uniref:Putative RNase H n=1 Tax=Trypanosoma cruzi TaxID=5693 RepID=A0A2V2X1J9_TRYCR|nr:putative RNase H [Trypanosoma cruzi]RNC48043.1 ribonuclease HI [Trypanosoma cruzi]